MKNYFELRRYIYTRSWTWCWTWCGCSNYTYQLSYNQLYKITSLWRIIMKLIVFSIILFKLKLLNARIDQNKINGFSSFEVNGKSLSRSDRIGAKIPLTSFGLKRPEFRSKVVVKSHAKESNKASNLPFLSVVDDSIVGMYVLTFFYI